MRYSLTSEIAELLGTDISERGVNALLICPFHEEKSPSFSIHLEEGLWQCFGCGKKGGIKSLYRELGESFSQEVYQDMLIRSVRKTPHSKADFTYLASKHVNAMSRGEGHDVVAKYLSSKPISPDFIRAFGVGWSEENGAISMPYWDNGVAVGIKYRYKSGNKAAEPGSSFGIYGIDNIRGKKNVILCEGESDTHAMWSLMRHDASFGVAGVSGAIRDRSTWELWMIDMMFAKKVYIAFDADKTGDSAFDAAAEVIGTPKCSRIRPSAGKDICEHIINGGTFVELGLEG